MHFYKHLPIVPFSLAIWPLYEASLPHKNVGTGGTLQSWQQARSRTCSWLGSMYEIFWITAPSN